MHPFSEDPRETVATLGETRLIHHIKRWLGKANPPAPHGIGDDCAVVPWRSKGCDLLVTTDPVVYGRHFDHTVSGRAAGAKLLKRNLSDIAAMGGDAVAAVVSISLPANTSVAWLRDFYRGIVSVSLRLGVPLVGGDVSRSDSCLAAHLTLFGRAPAGRSLTRTGARPKDVVVVTGPLGGSILGHHLTFEPRLKEGAWLATRPEVHACMDLSDGLAKDLPALVPTGCAALIDTAMIPISAAARRLARKTARPAVEHAVCDGEDYELIACVDGEPNALRRLAEAFHRRFDTQLHVLGVLHKPTRPHRGHPVLSLGGDLDWAHLGGYEHFRETASRG